MDTSIRTPKNNTFEAIGHAPFLENIVGRHVGSMSIRESASLRQHCQHAHARVNDSNEFNRLHARGTTIQTEKLHRQESERIPRDCDKWTRQKK